MKNLNIIDMFCGGGGESTGIFEAAKEYDFNINMSAINHWERAIETHSANYPSAEHRCENVQHIEPNTLMASKNTDLLWASPGCQHFSTARGAKPRSESMRSPAWEVLRFAEELRPKRIIIENVPEFRTWGPLDENGKIIKECKGTTFNAFIAALKSLNYIVDYQVLCAADYGAATSRRRLFIQAVRKDCAKKIIWPEKTNINGGDFILPSWHTASEIIYWTIPCQLISERKKPLAAATMRRIEYGIREFWREEAEPFITAIGQSSAKQRNRKLTEPLSTICTKQEHCLVKPMLVQYYGNGHAVPLSDPIPTLTTKDRYALVNPKYSNYELGFRMLQPNELAAATGFPSDYKFTGTKVEVVKQIGNAVPPNFAKAIFGQILKEMVS
ncbi:MAG: DNA cytosine methyltransferase [Treponema sp.]|nr:DNA cytosine methyltransferase [Candidatus Treponema caballi]